MMLQLEDILLLVIVVQLKAALLGGQTCLGRLLFAHEGRPARRFRDPDPCQSCFLENKERANVRKRCIIPEPSVRPSTNFRPSDPFVKTWGGDRRREIFLGCQNKTDKQRVTVIFTVNLVSLRVLERDQNRGEKGPRRVRKTGKRASFQVIQTKLSRARND